MFKKSIKYLLPFMCIGVVWIATSCTYTTNIAESDSMKKNIIITAHRGGAGYGAENSLSCIARSLEAGVSSIEIDVQLSKDGHVVVCHDNKVNRTTNGKGKISEMTLDELHSLRLKDNNGKITDEHIPLLSEVLQLINGKAHLLLEIKRYHDTAKELQAAVVNELICQDALSWTTVQSFNDETLDEMHSLLPSLRLEKLAVCKIAGLPIIFDGGFRKFNLKKYDYIESFNLYYGGISESFVKELHKAGKRVRIWTVNKPKHIPNLQVDGIITDYPDLIMQQYNTK